tara:strand:- start:228 stop:689 length:462 start_codon:yes stop_codon:yes gene_type:complete
MPQAICLKAIGKITEFDVTDDINIHKKTLNHTKHIPRNIRRTIGDGKLKKIHNFLLNEKYITLFAWENGEAGTENKHELPPPIDNKLLFGNSYLFAHIGDKLVNFSKKEYDDLMNQEFEGFDDIDSDDTWSEEEDLSDSDSLNDFITDDDDFS